jgi:hypothetical protein
MKALRCFLVFASNCFNVPFLISDFYSTLTKGEPQAKHNGKYRPENDRPSCRDRYPANLLGKPEESDYCEKYS